MVQHPSIWHSANRPFAGQTESCPPTHVDDELADT